MQQCLQLSVCLRTLNKVAQIDTLLSNYWWVSSDLLTSVSYRKLVSFSKSTILSFFCLEPDRFFLGGGAIPTKETRSLKIPLLQSNEASDKWHCGLVDLGSKFRSLVSLTPGRESDVGKTTVRLVRGRTKERTAPSETVLVAHSYFRCQMRRPTKLSYNFRKGKLLKSESTCIWDFSILHHTCTWKLFG